jgi:transposase
LACHQKKAQEIGATIAFIDECAVMSAPVVCRTWAPRGQTPILKRVGRHHTKVSVIGAICAKPGRRKSARVYFRIHRGRNLDGVGCREFLRQLLGNIKGPVIVVWDRLNAHRSKKVKAFVAKQQGRLLLRYFPAYAPELNPIETAWGYLKGKVLANHAPANADELFHAAKRGLCKTRSSRQVVCSFIEHSGLSFFD